MNWKVAVGWVILLSAIVGGLWFGSAYAEKQGYCILVCDARAKLAELQAERDQAIDRAEEAEDRAEEAERKNQGLSPWVGVVSLFLVLLLFFMNEIVESGSQNITMKQAIEIGSDWLKEYYNVVPDKENPGNGWIRPWWMPGQKVPGSKDSWFYFVSYVMSWPPGMAYPPGSSCYTMYMLSTDHERAIGFIPGMSCREVMELWSVQLQKTPNASDLAQALDTALREKELKDAISVAGGENDN